jgi:phosphoglucosamine mutase
VKVAQRYDPTGVPVVQAAVRRIEARLAADGRVVLRASGTEPVIRVMVEAREAAAAQWCAEELAAVVRDAAA